MTEPSEAHDGNTLLNDTMTSQRLENDDITEALLDGTVTSQMLCWMIQWHHRGPAGWYSDITEALLDDTMTSQRLC